MTIKAGNHSTEMVGMREIKGGRLKMVDRHPLHFM